MPDDKKADTSAESQGFKSQGDRVEAGKVENVEANAARQATGTEVKQAQDTNPNKSTGSAGGDPRLKSLEIDFGGGNVVNKETVLTEVQAVAQAAAIKASPLKSTPLDEDGRPIVSPEVEKVNKHFFKVEVDYQAVLPEAKDPRTPYDKLCDFAKAAGARATDPKGWQDYIDGEIELGKGVWSGLNKTKEHIKSMPGEVAQAFQDGRVANFLSHPENLKDPICKLIGGALWASTHGAEFTNMALTAVGTAIVKGSAEYSKLDKFHKGEVVGDTMFAFINPSGSTEGGELALKIADKTATNVDLAVSSCMTQMKANIQIWKIINPERAQAMNQILEDFSEYIFGKPMRPAYATTGPANFPENLSTRPEGIPKVEDNPNVLKMEGKGEPFENGNPSDKPSNNPPSDLALPKPSAAFVEYVADLVKQLPEFERATLAEYNYPVKAIRRVSDRFPEKIREAACYAPEDRCIYVAEEVLKLGKWVKNEDATFQLRHEFGHFYNARTNAEGNWSDFNPFKNAFNADFDLLSKEKKAELLLGEPFKNKVASRDEVFADLYAHSRDLVSSNPYSQKMLAAFPSVLKTMKEMFK